METYLAYFDETGDDGYSVLENALGFFTKA